MTFNRHFGKEGVQIGHGFQVGVVPVHLLAVIDQLYENFIDFVFLEMHGEELWFDAG